jgi:hypothetical protein
MLVSVAIELPALSVSTYAGASPMQGYELPAQFVANRVFVTPVTVTGKSLRFYTDSGGGLFVTEDAAKRLGLQPVPPPANAKADDKEEKPQQVPLPKFKTGLGIPLPTGGSIAVMPQELVAQQKFVEDGMLGEAWFGGHVWTWNYPAGKLRIEGSDWKPDPSATRVALGFPLDKNGERDDNFARITIRVDSKPIDMLLDTGATTTLSAEALKIASDALPAERATSFIVDTQYQAWHKDHPDWRVIDKGEAHTNAWMIEVPEVEIAGTLVGPVWFTWRQDKSFHEFMSSMMDKQVEGAIGGNALAHFVMTVDYPGAAAYFRCASGCKVKPQSAP